MKKLHALILAGLMVLLSACGSLHVVKGNNNSTNTAGINQPTISTIFFDNCPDGTKLIRITYQNGSTEDICQ
jgi:hypothetical protein